MKLSINNGYQAVFDGNTSSRVEITIAALPAVLVTVTKSASADIDYGNQSPFELYSMCAGVPVLHELMDQAEERPQSTAAIDRFAAEYLTIDAEAQVKRSIIVKSLDDLLQPLAELILALLLEGVEVATLELAEVALKYAGSILAEARTAEAKHSANLEARAYFTELTQKFDVQSLLS